MKIRTRRLAALAAGLTLATAGLTLAAPADTASASCNSKVTVLNQGPEDLYFYDSYSYIVGYGQKNLCSVGSGVVIPRGKKLILWCQNGNIGTVGTGGIFYSHSIEPWQRSWCGGTRWGLTLVKK